MSASLLALNFLPRTTPRQGSTARHTRDAVIAVAVGAGAAALTYLIQTTDFAFDSIAAYHLENAKTGGGGYNVVNVILVDFRGFDTLGEITVLGLAAMGVWMLLRKRAVARPAPLVRAFWAMVSGCRSTRRAPKRR